MRTPTRVYSNSKSDSQDWAVAFTTSRHYTGIRSVVAWAAFLLSLLALFLFLISNYKKIYTNTIQFLVDTDLKIRLETGSNTSEDGEVTVGGPPDDF